MVSIRLARFGKRKFPTYRIIVSDKRKDTKGTYLEAIGHYNPHAKPPELEVNADRLKYWLGVGAQPSDTVHNLLVTKGLIQAEKRTYVKAKKKPEESGEAGSGTAGKSAEAPAPPAPAVDVSGQASAPSGEAGSGSAGKPEPAKPEPQPEAKAVPTAPVQEVPVPKS